MTGLLLLIVVGIWFFVTIKIVIFIAGKLPEMWWRPVVGVGLFALIFSLPLLDEIIGGQQFEQLCKENSMIQVDRAKAIGKTVYSDLQPRIEVKGTWVPIVLQQWRYVDATTDELVVSYSSLIASGGRFIQMLGISEGGMPLTFNGSCGPKENTKKLFKSLEIIALDRPQENTKGK
jgi:hypothetical protein